MIQYSNIPLWLSITNPYRWKVEKEIARVHEHSTFREYRMSQGLRIQDVMERTGLSKPTVVNIEKEKKRAVSDMTWLRVASFYGELASGLYVIKGRDVRTVCLAESFINGMSVQQVAKYMLDGGTND